MESNSVCNHTSDNKIGRPRSGSPICLSQVWLQTELDNTKSYYQLIIKITISLIVIGFKNSYLFSTNSLAKLLSDSLLSDSLLLDSSTKPIKFKVVV